MPAVLASRAEVVAEADALAVRGTRAGGAPGADLILHAARLRQRLWRLERREADALEAVELYRSVERTKSRHACDAALDRALIEGELRADPARTYEQVYAVRSLEGPAACHERARSILDTLEGFRPPSSVLSAIDRGDAGAAEPDGSAHAAPPIGPVIVPTTVSDRGAPARITAVERYGAEDAARIVVFVTQPSKFDVGFIPAEADRGPRLYIDVERAVYEGRAAFDVGGIVERVRVGKRATSTRLVLDLRSEVYRKVFYLPEPFRLVIDVSKQAPPRTTDTGARPVRRVVIDPGHGGHDPGAVGPGGLREKDVTLDIAHRAAPLVARELGIATLLTRDADVYVPLDERTARANAFQADLFVSIHCNASEKAGSHGVMTFVLDQSRDPLAAQIAARENAASPAAAAELANVFSRVQGSASVARSVSFADLLQRSAMASLKPAYPEVRDGGVRRAGFYVLAGAHMPAVLHETSFISNPLGEVRLNTGDYRQKVADAIVNAVRAYQEGRR